MGSDLSNSYGMGDGVQEVRNGKRLVEIVLL